MFVRARGLVGGGLIAVSAIALTPTSGLAGCGNNPYNHGHHYGQVKRGVCTIGPPPTVQPAVGVKKTLQQIPVVVPANRAPAPIEAPIGAVIPPDQSMPSANEFRDRNLWIVTALLPTLLVLWALVAARAASLRRQRPLAAEATG